MSLFYSYDFVIGVFYLEIPSILIRLFIYHYLHFKARIKIHFKA